MIQSFGDQETYDLFVHGDVPKKGAGWASQSRTAYRKLEMIDAASEVSDFRIPPGNRLEKLRGRDSNDWWSIRINDQWRITFQWTDEGPEFVKIVDYHD
jgi:proteic killer suppression protein